MIRRTPPRLVVRTTVTTFAVVALVLTAALLALALTIREHVRGSVADRLAAGQRMLFALEQRRAHELRAQVATLAENPTLKAAIDTHRAELRAGDRAAAPLLLATIGGELRKIAEKTRADVLAVRAPSGELLAVAGTRGAGWMGAAATPHPAAEFVALEDATYRVASAPIALNEVQLGRLELATPLDSRYASELSSLSGARIVIASPTA